MNVELIAWTQVNWGKIQGYKGFQSDARQGIEALVEFAGAVEVEKRRRMGIEPNVENCSGCFYSTARCDCVQPRLESRTRSIGH